MEHAQSLEALRTEIRQALENNDNGKAHALLVEFWHRSPGPGTAAFLTASYGRMAPPAQRASLKAVVLRSFTVEPVFPILQAAALTHHLDLQVAAGEFNAYSQEILSPDSLAYAEDVDVVILAFQTRDIAPDLWARFPELDGAEVKTAVDRVVSDIGGLMSAFRERTRVPLVVHNLECPANYATGVLDAQAGLSQSEAFRRINEGLRLAAESHQGVHVFDYDALVSRHGRDTWTDEGRWLTMRMPISGDHMVSLAEEWLKVLLPLSGRICKALIVDLDNTLWGGVVGEDSPQGIRLDGEYPGAVFQAFQRAVLNLYHRGVILGICSKNNPADAMAVLEDHPGMILRPHHFAAIRANWTDKVSNLRDIASELRIGTDALAFVDDNPAERFAVRSMMPEVTVIDLPEDPLGYVAALAATPVFERLALSEEDRKRGGYYAQERERDQLRQEIPSLEDYYRSLNMRLELLPANPTIRQRIAQLTQRTNQFNLTTRRYTEQDITAFVEDPAMRVWAARTADRFGDNGIIGVVILRLADGMAEVDCFLLSCRVIGRTIETALLAAVADQAKATGALRLTGRFEPTEKNAPAAEFYENHGFSITADDDRGSTWEFDLAADRIETSPWVECRIEGNEET